MALLSLSACDLFQKDDPLKVVQGVTIENVNGVVAKVTQNKVTGKFSVPLSTSDTYSASWLNVQDNPIILVDLKGKTLAFDVADANIAEASVVSGYTFSIKGKTAGSTTVVLRLVENGKDVFKTPAISILIKG
jgi:Flp pilus assembly secretin CpaC